MAGTKKQAIPYKDLLEKVQGLLASYPKECRDIHVDSLEVYGEQVDGANWHITRMRRSGDDNDVVECREKIVSDIRLLREHYDVSDKS